MHFPSLCFRPPLQKYTLSFVTKEDCLESKSRILYTFLTPLSAPFQLMAMPHVSFVFNDSIMFLLGSFSFFLNIRRFFPHLTKRRPLCVLYIRWIEWNPLISSKMFFLSSWKSSILLFLWDYALELLHSSYLIVKVHVFFFLLFPFWLSGNISLSISVSENVREWNLTFLNCHFTLIFDWSFRLA